MDDLVNSSRGFGSNPVAYAEPGHRAALSAYMSRCGTASREREAVKSCSESVLSGSESLPSGILA